MAQGAGVGGNIDWVSEGIATFLGSHMPRKGRWELARPAREPYANGFEPGPFAWVKGQVGESMRGLRDDPSSGEVAARMRRVLE